MKKKLVQSAQKIYKKSPIEKNQGPSFPIVGIGASAGGLEAFTQLLKELPADTGMAFVLIQHLDPTHSSYLTQALVKTTAMPIREIYDGLQVQQNHVYVIPPNFDLDISHNTLHLLPRSKLPGQVHLPINAFFRSLAANCERRAIGVVLSGTASDGTEGLRAIKDEGGFTFAQDPRSAKYSGMPESAVQAGVVDYSLSIPKLAEELTRLARSLYYFNRKDEPFSNPADQHDFEAVLNFLNKNFGVNFHEYKSATTKRRLARRLALLKIETLNGYLKFLRENANEARTLCDDILIHVTSFFRDPEAFTKLQEEVFPVIVKQKQAGKAIRMWVAGCSTGEEVYSLVISLLEFLGEDHAHFPIQIFGSDISERVIEKARLGFYPDSVMREMDPERLQRYFVKTEGGYRISKLVRDLCIFVRHDLARDPPFSRLDLITCRNVLIYFDLSLQKRILATFHYCLSQPGFLLLGRTENASSNQQLFISEDKINKIFSRTAFPTQLRFPLLKEMVPLTPPKSNQAENTHVESNPGVDIAKTIDTLLLSEYTPCGVLVNEQMEALLFRGRTSHYLEQAPGPPETNLLKMVREGLFVELKMALAKAKKEHTTVRKNNVKVKHNGSLRLCNIVVRPINAVTPSREQLFLVLFEEAKALELSKKTKGSSRKLSKKELLQEDTRSNRLEQELEATKEYLQSLNQEHQKTNDALGTANEELVSGNEELQSMNEELETAKEELQSINEELTTVNDELQHRNSEVGQVNNDLINLLNCVEIPIVILDLKRRVRRFTPHARVLFNLVPSDVGRSIDDIKINFPMRDLNEQIAAVISSGAIKESEVQDETGRWHQIQIRPYKTLENKIDGVILSLVDINTLKNAISKAEWARDYAKSIVEATQVPLVVLDKQIRVISANKAFYEIFGVSKSETEDKFLYKLGINQWNIPSLRASLEEILKKKTEFQNEEVERDFPNVGRRTMSLSARSIHSDADIPAMILLSMEDITERKELLRQIQEAKEEAEEANRTKDLFLATLSHELRTPLTSLILQAQLLRRSKMDEAKIMRASEVIESAAKVQAQLIGDLLDISRIVTGKLKMEMQAIDLSAVALGAVETVRAFAESSSIEIELNAPEKLPLMGDAVRLQQVIWNLLTNAVKFSNKGSTVFLTLKTIDDVAQIQVKDTGKGIEAEFLPVIFKRFTQAEDAMTRSHGGLGLGLAIVRTLVEMHGGEVHVQSPGKGKGSTFTVTLPLSDQKPEKDKPSEVSSKKIKDGDKSIKESHASKLNGRRILVVEDDLGTREALGDLLAQAGASVRTAESAAEGMRLLQEFKPEEMVCDIAMPNEDGYTFIRKVRKLAAAQGGSIPAIALTAFASDKDREQALAAGFQMHLAKPLDFHTLEDALGRLA